MVNTHAVSTSLSRAVYFEKIARYETSYQINVYADMFQAHALVSPPINKTGKANKKKLKGFSNESRHRMIEFLAKVIDVPDLFVTMTYSDDVAKDWIFKVRDHMELFRKQLEYHYPNVRAVWRLELVTRKSGAFYGQFIPHWHMLVWLPKDCPPERKAKILEDNGQLWRNAWHKITHSTDAAHLAKFGVQVTECKSRKHAYSYCSKYLAKSEYETMEAGRRWGRIGQFDIEPELSTEITQRQYVHLKRLLNAYLKAEALKRFKHQKIIIPYAPLPLSHFEQFWRYFKRMTIAKGSTVFGLGFISQNTYIDTQTIYKMIRHARDLSLDDNKTLRIESVRSMKLVTVGKE
jgi:hypothetical protein